MLIPGIKLGPTDWQSRLDATNSSVAEIWYRIDWADKYQELINELHRRQISFGLHFWGITSNGYEANLAYPGKNYDESKQLVKQCIDQAAKINARYVNIHSGNTTLMHLNFESEYMQADPNIPEISDEESIQVRTDALYDLGSYANNRNVQLLVELIPGALVAGAWYASNSRNHAADGYPTSPKRLIDLCAQKYIGFTNDFCHTFSMPVRNGTKSREELYPTFINVTKQFAPYTKVVHINTLTEPYNGTDAHNGILDTDFNDPTVFPTKTEFHELFTLITNHQSPTTNTWLIGEPKDHHVENYFALKNLSQTT